MPLEKGSSRILFHESSEFDLTESCVQHLLAEDKSRNKATDETTAELTSAVRKLLAFMMRLGGRRKPSFKVIFSPSVSVAFAHGQALFCPRVALTRYHIKTCLRVICICNNPSSIIIVSYFTEVTSCYARTLLVKLLNVVQAKIEGASADGFTALIQALFETLPAGAVGAGSVDAAIERAKAVQKENDAFLRPAVRPNEVDPIVIEQSPPKDKRKQAERTGAAKWAEARLTDRARRSNGSGTTVLSSNSKQDLLQQIASASSRGNSSSSSVAPLIPASAFAADGAGNETCLRPSSALQRLTVGASLGGGELFVDAATALNTTHWTPRYARRLCALRSLLGEAINWVARYAPICTHSNRLCMIT